MIRLGRYLKIAGLVLLITLAEVIFIALFLGFVFLLTLVPV